MAIDPAVKPVLDALRNDLTPVRDRDAASLNRIHVWSQWKHEPLSMPLIAGREYKSLADEARTPWLALAVTAVVQNLKVEGHRAGKSSKDSKAWDSWQANSMDSRQMGLHRDAVRYGLAYGMVLPGKDPLTGDKKAVIRTISPRRMVALFDDDQDDFPEIAAEWHPAKRGVRKIDVIDDKAIHHFVYGEDLARDDGWEYLGSDDHGMPVCPIVRYSRSSDTENSMIGEVEPYIDLARRINQGVFDRLVVQRFASWKVRTVTGMAEPDDDEEAARSKLKLKVNDLLVAEDPDTKFGTLDASPMEGYISAHDADLRDFGAVTQTPPHWLLGQMVNVSAEALSAASAATDGKLDEWRLGLGEAHEKLLRLCAFVQGDTKGMNDMESQIRWADTGSKSLAQVADAFGKIAATLKVPVEMLWERLPGWTDQDVERAKELVTDKDGVAQLMSALARQNMPAQLVDTAPGAPPKPGVPPKPGAPAPGVPAKPAVKPPAVGK